MGEPISNTIIKTVVERPVSHVYDEIKIALLDFNSNLENLQITRTVIEALLLDAKNVELSHTQQNTLEKLHDQLHWLVDFLEEKECRAMLKQAKSRNWLLKIARLFYTAPNQLSARFIDARKVKAIREKLDTIARDHAQFGSIISLPYASQLPACNSRSIGPYIFTDMIIGRVRERETVISMISDDSVMAESLSVSSIVGIGGIGKTTLARYVYDDETMRGNFDVRFWVDAPQDFDVDEVLEKIVACHMTDQEELLVGEMSKANHYHRFIEAISGKKFLLVLDNIWDQEGLRLKWLDLRKLLEFGACGSKVLITTRNHNVAGVLDSKNQCTVRDLTKHESWLLFQQIAFTQWQDPGIEEIGKEIVKMCPNVPLVIKSVGAVLAGKRTTQEWQVFRNCQLANFSSYGRDVMHTLKLSYEHLDPRMKLCVKYCSLFPRGFTFEKEGIIRLWIALGYVVPKYKSQSLEEASEEYVICLQNSGFLYIISRILPFISIEQFRLHDVMHDLLVSEAGFKYKMADSNTSEFDERVRHLSFSKVVEKSFWEVPASIFKIKRLQSFIVVPPKGQIGVRNWSMCDKLIQRFQFLKILILNGLEIKELPRSLGQLICLRYLDISNSNIVQVPNSVSKLVNLLSLRIHFCTHLKELPEDMSKMVNLEHFEMTRSTAGLSHMPMGLNNLTNLKTLDEFVVCEGSMQNASKGNATGKLADLNGLNNLEGELRIHVRRGSKDLALEARAANLKMKEKLVCLEVNFKKSTKEDEVFLEELQPHPNLKFLRVNGYGGERLPRWMMDGVLLYNCLLNLCDIFILNCNSCRHLCSLGRLPHLESVTIRNAYNVEYIESDNGSGGTHNNSIVVDGRNPGALFPKLRVLWLMGMPKLKGWRNTLSSGNPDSRQVGQVEDHNLVEWKPPFPKLNELLVDNVELINTLARELGFTSLETLSIEKTLAVSSPSQPQALAIFKSHFPNLRYLFFTRIDELEFLPEELQDYSSLETLRVFRCKQLKAIPYWIDSLTSLKRIHINDCPILETLPHQISKLSKLQSFEIFECCTMLEERCRKTTGEYWPFIQHIPCVHVTTFNMGTYFQRLRHEI